MRLDKICRACLCEDDNMINMLEKNIFKKFLTFTDLPVQKEILNVSLNLCQSCEEKLNVSCAFKEKCLKSHQILLCHVNNAEALQIGCDEQEDVEEPHVETDNKLQWTATINQDEVEEPIVTTDNNNLQLIAADDREGVEELPVTTGKNIVQLITTDKQEDLTEPPLTTYNKQYSTLQKFSPDKVSQAIAKSKRYFYVNTKCIHCDYVGLSFRALCSHMSNHHRDLKQSWCHFCNKAYEDLTNHREIRHSKDLTCTFCKKKFMHKANLHLHLRKHSGVPLFLCWYCEKSFVSHVGLGRHLKVHKKAHSGSNKRGEKLSLRNEAGKSLMQRSHLVEHNTTKRSHLPSAPTYNNKFQSIVTDEHEGSVEPPVTTNNLTVIPTDEQAGVEEPSVTADNNNSQLIAADDGEAVEESPVITGNKKNSMLQTFSPDKVSQAIEKSKRYFYVNTKCIHCDYVGSSFRVLSSHMSNHHRDLKQSWCHFCNKTYEDLTNHREIRHSKELTCTFCKKIFMHKASLHLHLRRHSGVPLFLCGYCEKCFVSRVDLGRHLKVHKKLHSGSSKIGEKLSLRSECGKSFQSIEQEGSVEPPVTTNNLPLIPTDEQAGVEEPPATTDNRKNSMLQTFPPDEVSQAIEKSKRYFYVNTKCVRCDYVAVHLRALSAHMSHLHKDLSWCNLCNEEHKDLTNHRETQHSDHLTCKFCKHEFVHKSKLHGHLLRHSGVQLFMCWYCEKCFVSRVHLDGHLKLHEKPYDCRECIKTFTHFHLLQEHLKEHETGAVVTCKQPQSGSNKGSICSKQFETTPKLRMRTENVRHKWKSFSHCSMLCTHMKLHTGHDGVWKVCDQVNCGPHLRKDNGEKSHVCNECGKSFMQLRHLVEHKKTHTDLRVRETWQ